MLLTQPCFHQALVYVNLKFTSILLSLRQSLSRDRVNKQNYLTGLEMPADLMGLQHLKHQVTCFLYGLTHRTFIKDTTLPNHNEGALSC